MNLAHFVHKWARATPNRPAVALGDRCWQDYRTLSERVATLASGLIATGLEPGDRVAIAMKNDPRYFEILFACWHAGLVAVPVNAKLHPKEIGFILSHSGAGLCLASPGLLNGHADLPCRAIEVPSAAYEALGRGDMLPIRRSPPDTLAWLFYTSGTTGRPKGAMLSHRNLLTMCHCYIVDVDDQPPWSAILHPAPLSHGSGLYALPHLMQGSCQIVPESGGFEPDEIFDMIGAWAGAAFFAAPTMIHRLIGHQTDRDTSGLKLIVSGGAPLHVADTNAYLDRFGPKLAQLYGQGETPMTITSVRQSIYADRGHPRWESRIASVGLPQSAMDVLVVDDAGTPVPTGEVGEVICRGDCVMQGYWKDDGATALALDNGWLRTGDMGAFDEDGFLTLTDRAKDVIISGGANIYPREVEEVLLRHPAVAEVSVIGRADAEWGEVVVAFVTTKPGCAATEAELDALCLANVARFKRPRSYRFVDALPKSNYGKILKTRLREIDRADDSGQ